jgi:hypothetical protein
MKAEPIAKEIAAAIAPRREDDRLRWGGHREGVRLAATQPPEMPFVQSIPQTLLLPPI